MKRTLLLATIVIMAIIPALSQTLTKTYHFPYPVLISEGEYTVISYPDCYNFGPEGYPSMPHKAVSLLLPQNTEISGVNIVSTAYYGDKESITIKPAGRQFPLSDQQATYTVSPDKELYSSMEPYPERIADNIHTGFLSGHGIGSLTLCPVTYIPGGNTAGFLKSITLEIVLKNSADAAEAQKFLVNPDRSRQRIQHIVENPGKLEEYTYPDGKSSDEIDILLITNQNLMPYFEDYTDYKRSTGYITSIITTEDIFSIYSGTDQQDKIRNCIIDHVQNYNVQWVILGGDSDPNNASEDVIPHRGFYCNAYSTPEEDLPADIYYSNLDGNWDDDNDQRYGEPGEEDLYAEVGIGRICADDSTEIQNVVNKHILYQDDPVNEDIEKALWLGEMLWPEPTWGGDYKDEVALGSSNHGYTTVGLSSNFNMTYLYERDMYWDKNDVFHQYSNVGVNLRNHLGHSGTTYNMLMYNTDLTTTNFTNDGITRGFAIGYSQGCYNGAFDNRETSPGYYTEDCFSEKITTMETADVANIGNSRYGWGQHMSTDGASQYFDRQFFDAVFGEDITMIGEANRDSKEDNVAFINAHSGAIRWCYYELNLFGDPTLDIWTAQPAPIVASYPPAISIGTSQISIETDAPGARIGLMQDGSLIGRGLADDAGNLLLDLFEPLSSEEPIQASVICHNRIRHTGSILVITDEPYVVYESHTIVDTASNGNSVIEFGENISLDFTVKNIGTVASENVDVCLGTNDPYITWIDSTESYGSLDPGQSATKETAFTFLVAENLPDQHLINFTVTAISDTTWTSHFDDLGYGPVLTILEMVIDDSQGNNNGRLDPGETAILKVKNRNTGHCPANNCLATIETSCHYLEFQNTTDSIGQLNQIGYKYAEFEVVVDPETPNGVVFAYLNYHLQSNAYEKSKVFRKKLGLLVEDFETGDFTKFDWEMGGDEPWEITSTYPYEGIYSAKTGAIDNGEKCVLSLQMRTMTSDSISFIKKVSSEEDLDKLKFYINGNLKAEWSGTYQGWTKETFFVPTGNHTFKWVYAKDATGSAGADQAWLDFIIMPPKTTLTCYAGPDEVICTDEDFQCHGEATAYNALEWNTSGTGTFNDETLLNPVYSPSTQDIQNGGVLLTLTAYGDGDSSVEDEMALDITGIPGMPDIPDGPGYVDLLSVQYSEYSIDPLPGATAYNWYLEPGEAGIMEGNNETAIAIWNANYMGTAHIRVSAANMCGSGPESDPCEVILDNTTNIQEPVNDLPVSYHPNPTSGILKITLNHQTTQGTEFMIIDLLGKTMGNWEIPADKKDMTINLHDFPEGLYIGILIQDNVKKAAKIIIAR